MLLCGCPRRSPRSVSPETTLVRSTPADHSGGRLSWIQGRSRTVNTVREQAGPAEYERPNATRSPQHSGRRSPRYAQPPQDTRRRIRRSKAFTVDSAEGERRSAVRAMVEPTVLQGAPRRISRSADLRERCFSADVAIGSTTPQPTVGEAVKKAREQGQSRYPAWRPCV